MENTIRKICLVGIYAGIGAVLLLPLLLHNGFYYPFISTRVFLFRAVVQVLLLLYLVLNFVSDQYRPRASTLTVLIAAFIVMTAVSSILGPAPSASFWGDIERGEGLLLWLHLFAFFVVATSAARSRRAWAALLDWSLFIAMLMALVGLSQALRLGIFLAPSGSRVDATLGNPAYFATYLLFHLAFAVYLFGERRSILAKTYYIIASLLFVFLLQATQTRGALVGLAIGILAGAILYLFSARENRIAKRWSAAVILAVVVLSAGLYIFRGSAVVQSVPGLRRVANVSLESRTARTRLVTWQAAWRGFLEKPFLGWGQDNFTVVFNQRFPPYIYASEGSQVWFDRAHNLFFDRAVAGGVFGFVLFLAILGYPLYYLIRHCLRDPDARRAGVIFASLLVAYLVQDMFIFENIAIYFILFLALGLLSALFLPELSLRFPWASRRGVLRGMLITYAVALLPVLWLTVFYPARVNLQAAAAGKSNPVEEDFFLIVDRHRKYLDGRWTYGMPEYRLQFIDFVGKQLASVGEIVERVKPALAYTDKQVELLLAERPFDAKSWLVGARHYNYTHASLPAERQARLRQAMEYAEKTIELSPTRPSAVQEAGYAHLYMYRAARDAKDEALAAESLARAEEYFQRTVDLNPAVYESYVNLIMLHLNAGQTEKITPVVAAMEEAGVNFRLPERLRDLANLSRNNQNYYWIGYFARELSILEPDNPDALVDWALAEAYQGHRDKAIEIANMIRRFGSNYSAEADAFIAKVQSGFFEEEARRAASQQ